MCKVCIKVCGSKSKGLQFLRLEIKWSCRAPLLYCSVGAGTGAGAGAGVGADLVVHVLLVKVEVVVPVAGEERVGPLLYVVMLVVVVV